MHHRAVHTAAETLNSAASLAEQQHSKLADTREVRPLFHVSKPLLSFTDGPLSQIPPLSSSTDGPLSQIPPSLLHRWPSVSNSPPLLHRWPAVSNSPLSSSTDGPVLNSPFPPSQMALCLKFPLPSITVGPLSQIPPPLLHRWATVPNAPSPPTNTKSGIPTDEHTANVHPVPSTNTFHFL
jgi:hypothetical protein